MYKHKKLLLMVIFLEGHFHSFTDVHILNVFIITKQIFQFYNNIKQ